MRLVGAGFSPELSSPECHDQDRRVNALLSDVIALFDYAESTFE